jgi:hypothetical protein
MTAKHKINNYAAVTELSVSNYEITLNSALQLIETLFGPN